MFGGKRRDALGPTMSCVAEQLAVFFWDEGQVKIATGCIHAYIFDIYHDFSPTTNISRGSTQSGNKPEHIWPIAVIALSIHMADGVLTSCLYHDPGQNIFWHASFTKKLGACVDDQFWLTKRWYQDNLKWKNNVNENCAYYRDKQLWFLDHLNPRSYATCGAKILWTCPRASRQRRWA